MKTKAGAGGGAGNPPRKSRKRKSDGGGAEAADEAIDRVRRAADREVISLLQECMIWVAYRLKKFRTKMVWARYREINGPPVRERRVMGYIVRWAAGDSVRAISRSEEWLPSGERGNNNRDQRVWYSRICKNRLRKPRRRRSDVDLFEQLPEDDDETNE
jgi:hypothetical protein